MSVSEIEKLREHSRSCDAEVSRGGEAQPCELPAVAAAFDEDGSMYPVCKHHARGRMMVSLRTLLGGRP